LCSVQLILTDEKRTGAGELPIRDAAGRLAAKFPARTTQCYYNNLHGLRHRARAKDFPKRQRAFIFTIIIIIIIAIIIPRQNARFSRSIFVREGCK